ncbi:MAG: BACON domain-containing carbohydrate-binding protein, partial [Syntrophorhabdales bacterium]
AASNASWITITSGSSGSGNGTVTYTVAANSATSSRSGTMTLGGQTHTATQAGTSPTCSVTLSSWGVNLGYASRQAPVQVYASSTCSWSASANVPWISFFSGTTGSGNGTVTFSVNDNTGAARTGTIGINGSTLIVNQAGQAP